MARLPPAEPRGLDLVRRVTYSYSRRMYGRTREPLDKLVLEYAEAMTRTPVEVSDELFGRLREHFDERQLVELTMAIALENLFSRSNWALGIEGEGFTEGMYCVAADPAGAAALAAGTSAR